MRYLIFIFIFLAFPVLVLGHEEPSEPTIPELREQIFSLEMGITLAPNLDIDTLEWLLDFYGELKADKPKKEIIPKVAEPKSRSQVREVKKPNTPWTIQPNRGAAVPVAGA